MFGDSVTVADTLLISGFSILIVFLVLLLLSFMIDFCAWLLRRREMKGEDGQRAETVKTGNGNAAAGMPSSQDAGAADGWKQKRCGACRCGGCGISGGGPGRNCGAKNYQSGRL